MSQEHEAQLSVPVGHRNTLTISIQAPVRGGIVVKVIGTILSILAFVGCNEPPPPPPPPPPPQPSEPAVAPADRDVASAVLDPYFFLIFDWAFSTSELGAASRDGFLDFRGKLLGSNESLPEAYKLTLVDYLLNMSSSPLAPIFAATLVDQSAEKILTDSVKGVVKTIPALDLLLMRHLGRESVALVEVFDFVPNLTWQSGELVGESHSSSGSDLSPEDARRIVWSMYFQQALKDANDGNLHRAHVLLADVLRTMNLVSRAQGGVDLGLQALFEQVVNDETIKSFTANLLEYVESQKDALVVSGEDAAVLKAAGHDDSAEFIRAALLAKFDLLVMPLIERAQDRAINGGFPVPSELAMLRLAIQRQIRVLKSGPVAESDDFYRSEAMKPGDPTAAALLGKLKAGSAGESLNKILKDLGEQHRPISQWYEEKIIAVKQHPLQLIDSELSSDRLSVGIPLSLQTSETFTRGETVLDFVINHPTLAQEVAEWYGGAEPSPAIQTGAGHFLLGWYWLELNRPSLARQAWVAGARQCLESVGSDGSSATAMRGLTGLATEMNAFRLLVAASFIGEAPPGVIIDRANSYEAEIRALTVNWMQSWVSAGHQAVQARAIIDAMFASGIGPESLGSPSGVSERYPFFEYRFGGGVVPDVVVDEAVAAEVFDNNGRLIPGDNPGDNQKYQKLNAFLHKFRLPSEFSADAKKRFAEK